MIALYIGTYWGTYLSEATNPQEYRAFGITLPIPVWAVLIACVVFLFSVVFFLAGFIRALIVRKNNYSDLESLISQILFQATQSSPHLHNPSSPNQAQRDSTNTHSYDGNNASNGVLVDIKDFVQKKGLSSKYATVLSNPISQKIASRVKASFLSNLFARFSKPFITSPNAIKNPHLRTLSLIISRFELLPNIKSSDCGNSRIDKLFLRLISISEGKFEDIHKYYLDKDSPFVLQNWQNYALKNAKNALEVIKDPSKPLLARRFALKVICDGGVPKEIRKALEVQDYLDKSSLKDALQTCLSMESNPLSFTQIVALCDSVGFSSDDYVELAKFTHSKLSPDKWLKTFNDLSDKSERAHKAFVFVLLELEMIERAQNEIKYSVSSNEMRGIRAYMELKRVSKENYPLEIFV